LYDSIISEFDFLNSRKASEATTTSSENENMKLKYRDNESGGYMKTIYIKLIVVLTFLLIFETYGNAQKIPEVTVNLDKQEISDTIPFDTPFILKIESTKLLKNIKIFLTDSNFEFKRNCNNDNEKNEGVPLNCWESQEGALLAAIRMPPLKPNRIFQLIVDATIEPDKDLVAEVRKKIAGNILGELNTLFSKNDVQITYIVNELKNVLPKCVPRNYKGLSLIPKDGSIFVNIVQNIKLEEKIKNTQKLLNPYLNIQGIINDFIEKAPDLANNFKELKNNISAISLVQIDLQKNELESIKKGKTILVDLSILTDDYISSIANGVRHIYYPYQMAVINEQKNLTEFQKAEECDEQIENYNILLSELHTMKLFLETITKKKAYIEQIEKINQKKIQSLISNIEICQDTGLTVLNIVNSLKDQFVRKDQIINSFVNDLGVNVGKDISFELSTSSDFKTRAKRYIIPDIGLAYAPEIKEIFPYFGVNFYFRPINKEVPLRTIKKLKNCSNQPLYKSLFFHRFSAVIGVSIKSIASSGRRENLFAYNALLFGFGYRITDALRITSGPLLFKALNPNRLISGNQIKGTPFISFSLDLDIKEIIDDFIGLIIGKNN